MTEIKLETNFRDFEYGVINVMKEVEHASEEGMEQAVIEYMNDSLDKEPKVPQRSGSLEASHSVFVNGKLVKTSANRPLIAGEKGTGATPLLSFPKLTLKLEGALVAHKPYAASIHEGVSRWGKLYNYYRTGSGPKWIQAKLLFAGKYFALIAGVVKWRSK